MLGGLSDWIGRKLMVCPQPGESLWPRAFNKIDSRAIYTQRRKCTHIRLVPHAFSNDRSRQDKGAIPISLRHSRLPARGTCLASMGRCYGKRHSALGRPGVPPGSLGRRLEDQRWRARRPPYRLWAHLLRAKYVLRGNDENNGHLLSGETASPPRRTKNLPRGLSTAQHKWGYTFQTGR